MNTARASLPVEMGALEESNIWICVTNILQLCVQASDQPFGNFPLLDDAGQTISKTKQIPELSITKSDFYLHCYFRLV